MASNEGETTLGAAQAIEGMPASELHARLFPLLLAAAERYLISLGVPDLKRIACSKENGSDLELEDITAFIQLNGSLQGGLMVTADHGFAQALAKRFMIEEINDEEAAGYAVEVVAEVANIICGSAVRDIDTPEMFLGNPLMILSGNMNVRTGDYEMQAFNTEAGRFRCFYIPMRDKAELASIVAL